MDFYIVKDKNLDALKEYLIANDYTEMKTMLPYKEVAAIVVANNKKRFWGVSNKRLKGVKLMIVFNVFSDYKETDNEGFINEHILDTI